MWLATLTLNTLLRSPAFWLAVSLSLGAIFAAGVYTGKEYQQGVTAQRELKLQQQIAEKTKELQDVLDALQAEHVAEVARIREDSREKSRRLREAVSDSDLADIRVGPDILRAWRETNADPADSSAGPE